MPCVLIFGWTQLMWQSFTPVGWSCDGSSRSLLWVKKKEKKRQDFWTIGLLILRVKAETLIQAKRNLWLCSHFSPAEEFSLSSDVSRIQTWPLLHSSDRKSSSFWPFVCPRSAPVRPPKCLSVAFVHITKPHSILLFITLPYDCSYLTVIPSLGVAKPEIPVLAPWEQPNNDTLGVWQFISCVFLKETSFEILVRSTCAYWKATRPVCSYSGSMFQKCLMVQKACCSSLLTVAVTVKFFFFSCWF